MLVNRQRQAGQAAAEYLGALLLISVVVAVLVTSGVGGQIAGALDRAVCEIAGGDCEGDAGGGPDVAGPEAPTVNPNLTSLERQALLGAPKDAQDALDQLDPDEIRWLRDNDREAAQAVDRAVDWRERKQLFDQYVDGELEGYNDYRESDDRDERLDFSNDGCSNSPDSTPFYDFTDACLRHDFGYRNSKDLDIFDGEKSRIDNQFRDDMRDHCAGRAFPLKPNCYAAGESYYRAVQAFG